MGERQDFAVEPADDAPKAPAPMVVIEYRNRGLPTTLIPAFVMLLLALGILSYQRQAPIRSLGTIVAPSPVAKTKGADAPSPASKPVVVLAKSTRPEAAAPVPEPASAEVAGGDEPSSRILDAADGRTSQAPLPDLAATLPPPPLRSVLEHPVPKAEPELTPDVSAPRGKPVPTVPTPAPKVAHVEEAAPKVTKEQVMADIRLEAERKDAERQRMEDLKPKFRAQLALESQRKIQDQRVAFHHDLRAILRSPSHETGPQIEALCDQYGRSPSPEVKAEVSRRLRRTHAGLSRLARVEMMRACGYPEPSILEYLSHESHRNMKMRGGPRDEDDVWVHASRLLLSMPPKASRSHASAKADSQDPAKARGSAATPGPRSIGRAK